MSSDILFYLALQFYCNGWTLSLNGNSTFPSQEHLSMSDQCHYILPIVSPHVISPDSPWLCLRYHPPKSHCFIVPKGLAKALRDSGSRQILDYCTLTLFVRRKDGRGARARAKKGIVHHLRALVQGCTTPKAAIAWCQPISRLLQTSRKDKLWRWRTLTLLSSVVGHFCGKKDVLERKSWPSALFWGRGKSCTNKSKQNVGLYDFLQDPVEVLFPLNWPVATSRFTPRST